jgi:hypothetical protein
MRPSLLLELFEDALFIGELVSDLSGGAFDG